MDAYPMTQTSAARAGALIGGTTLNPQRSVGALEGLSRRLDSNADAALMRARALRDKLRPEPGPCTAGDTAKPHGLVDSLEGTNTTLEALNSVLSDIEALV